MYFWGNTWTKPASLKDLSTRGATLPSSGEGCTCMTWSSKHGISSALSFGEVSICNTLCIPFGPNQFSEKEHNKAAVWREKIGAMTSNHWRSRTGSFPLSWPLLFLQKGSKNEAEITTNKLATTFIWKLFIPLNVVKKFTKDRQWNISSKRGKSSLKTKNF